MDDQGTTPLSTEPATYNMTVMPTKDQALYTAYNIAMLVTTAWIMFSMGSGTKLEVIKERLKRPVGPVVGLMMQCFILPALMFGCAHALNIDAHISVGMIITASCPGGAVSNMFTFWSRGDLDLSVTMTTISTALAIGFMPLNMYIYVRSWMAVEDIPFVDMVITILIVWVTVILGNLFGRFFPKTVPYLTKIGSAFGLLLVMMCGAIQAALFPEVFSLSWKIWFAAIFMPLLAWCVGFFVPMLFCQDIHQRTAIAYEVSVQNIALAISIVTIAYDNAKEASYYSQFIILYAAFQIVFGVGLSLVYNTVYRYQSKSTFCHQWSRYKKAKADAPKVSIKQVSVNGTVLESSEGGMTPSESYSNRAYRGSSFNLASIESDQTGAGFVPDGTTSSTTDLVTMNSAVDLLPAGSSGLDRVQDKITADPAENTEDSTPRISIIVGDE